MKANEERQIRILQPETEWVNLSIHSDYTTKMKQTRCIAKVTIENDIEVEDRSTCPMCMYEIKRSMTTYIPVRVRGDEDTNRVQVIQYGRDNLAQVINQIENLPEGKNMTDFDFKVTRKGEKLDTVYFWNLVNNPEFHRPINEAEAKLIVPNMDEILEILSEQILITRATNSKNAQEVTPVGGAGGETRKTPF